MTKSKSTEAINCTSCGAGLNLLGGGRVATTVCPYCSAQLDANKNFSVLRQFAKGKRPASRLTIGHEGRLFDAHWTVIGTIGMREKYQGQTWHWVDHQLYSPTHGYAWLTEESGRFTFSRRIRSLPNPRWVTPVAMEDMESAPWFHLPGKEFGQKYYESGMTEITFLEGEFTWAPEIGDKTYDIFATPAPNLFDILFSARTFKGQAGLGLSKPAGQENSKTGPVEAEEIRLLETAIVESEFGLTPSKRVAASAHPLDGLGQSARLDFIGLIALVSMIIAFGGWVVTQGIGQSTLSRFANARDLPIEVPLQVTKPNQGVAIEVFTELTNAWAWFDVTLYDPDDVPVFTTGREIGYYKGYTQGERWSEGSKSRRVHFVPKVAGTYTIELELSETGTWSGSGSTASRLPSSVRITASEGKKAAYWMLIFAIIFALIWLVSPLRRFFADIRNWSGTDW